MNNKLFVGNLSFKVTETELQEVFAQAGEVLSVSIPTDKYTGKKRGFGFVEMASQEAAEEVHPGPAARLGRGGHCFYLLERWRRRGSRRWS